MSWRTDYDSGKKVYVGPYLEPGLSSDELRDHFGKYGRIEAVWVARNPAGFAFVTYEDARDAEEACRHLDGTEFAGKRIRVEVARGPRNNRNAAAENGSRNSYSPKYRRSPSYGREAAPYSQYHRGYRSPSSGREGRRCDSRPVRSDYGRRDSRGGYDDHDNYNNPDRYHSIRDKEGGYASNGAVRRSGGSYHNHRGSREDDRGVRKRYDDRSRSRGNTRLSRSREDSPRRHDRKSRSKSKGPTSVKEQEQDVPETSLRSSPVPSPEGEKDETFASSTEKQNFHTASETSQQEE